MSIRHGRVSVGTAAVPLLALDGDHVPGCEVVIRNAAAMTVLVIGGEDVTAATGLEVPPGQSHRLHLGEGDRLFGVVAVGQAEAQMLQTGV